MIATLPLRVYLCGRLAIRNGDYLLREADFPTRQGRRLWCYLVLNRQHPVGRDALAHAIWGDDSPDAWDVALNALVSRLRAMLRALGPLAPRIVGDPGRYVLVLPTGAWVDYERARLALHDAQTLGRRGESGAALSEARVALEISGRGFLAGEDAPWITGQRHLLADIQLRALECTVEAELQRGSADRAEEEARRLIELDPLREAGYRLLMRALATGGNRAQVVRVYDECRRRLHALAAVEPSPQNVATFRDLAGG